MFNPTLSKPLLFWAQQRNQAPVMKDRKIYKNTLRLPATPLALVVALMSAAGLGRYVAGLVLAGLVLTARMVHLLPLSARWKRPQYHV